MPFLPAIWVEVGAGIAIDGDMAAGDVIADDEDDAELEDWLELFDW
ncbi:MAG TPA: hypothetical protein VGH54_12575 [Mycobacterium sp.]